MQPAHVVAIVAAVAQRSEEQLERALVLAGVERRERVGEPPSRSSRSARADRRPGSVAGTSASSRLRSSRLARAISMRASGTAASARPGASSSARRSDASSPRRRADVGLARHERVEEALDRRRVAGRRRTPRRRRRRETPSRPGCPGCRKACARRGIGVGVDLREHDLALARRAASSSSGPSARQGPHHAAQKSTTTGVVRERSMTSRSNRPR